MIRLIVLSLASCLLVTACPSKGGPLGDIQIAAGTNVATYLEAEREKAPSIAGEAVDEAAPAIQDSDIAGKVTVVNFWGSWCGPCRLEEPILEDVWSNSDADKVAFIGVNTRRDQRAAALAFLEEFGVTYPSVYDPSSSIAHAWGVRVMPATFVLDSQGRIAARIIGAVKSVEQLETLLEEMT